MERCDAGGRRGCAAREGCAAWLVVAVPQLWSEAVAAGDLLEGAEDTRIVASAEVVEADRAYLALGMAGSSTDRGEQPAESPR